MSAGHLIETDCRPNTGKTSFHASLVAGQGGFAHQGARCVVLCNEESAHRVGARYLTSATGMTMHEIKENPDKARDKYEAVKKNIFIKDASGRDMSWVESVCKSYKPDVVILDMGDKFAKTGGFARPDEALSKCNSCKTLQRYMSVPCFICLIICRGRSKVYLNQAMMEGSRTGKSRGRFNDSNSKDTVKNPDGGEEESPARHLNVVKNMLSGWHVQHCELIFNCEVSMKLTQM